MGLSAISWKNLKKLNRELDELFVAASVGSDGIWWVCIRHDGSALLVNRRTLETEPYTSSTTTMSMLRDRDPDRWPGITSPGWLAELDERQSQLVREPPE